MGKKKHGHDLLVEHQERLSRCQARHLVEIGSTRGGGSTTALVKLADRCDFCFTTCDILPGRAKAALVKADDCRGHDAVCLDGAVFLATLEDDSLAGVYLDAFDLVVPHTMKYRPVYAGFGLKFTQENCEAMHLACAKELVSKVCKGGLVCIDDTGIKEEKFHGKGATAVPYLLEHGFVLIDRFGSICGAVLLEKRC